MTDDQFDELCRSALAYEPGTASGSVWAKIRPVKRSWLPTIPEILACGGVCGLVLFGLGIRLARTSAAKSESNPLIQRAMENSWNGGRSLAGMEASTYSVPDTSSWTELTLTMPGAFRPGNSKPQ
jgi:hypothetical protein